MNRFAAFPAAAVFDKRLSPRDLTVLAAIGVHTDENGWCYPSLSRLGEILGVTRQAVQKSVRVLVGNRYLDVRHRYRADGSQDTNAIHVLDAPMEGRLP